MRNATFSSFMLAVLAALLFGGAENSCYAQAAGDKANDLPVVEPLAEGFSSQRLERLDAAMQGVVDQKKLAGIVIVLARHGKVVHFKALAQLPRSPE